MWKACQTGCTEPSTFRKVQFSNSAIYLLHICTVFYIWSAFVFYLYKEGERKITACLYVGEGSEYRPFQIFDAFGRPLTWGGDLKFRKGLFSDPSPTHTKPPSLQTAITCVESAVEQRFVRHLGAALLQLFHKWEPERRRTRKAPSAAVVRRRRFASHRSQEGTWLLPVQDSRQVQITNSSRSTWRRESREN
jgi:hypothetical protein